MNENNQKPQAELSEKDLNQVAGGASGYSDFYECPHCGMRLYERYTVCPKCAEIIEFNLPENQ